MKKLNFAKFAKTRFTPWTVSRPARVTIPAAITRITIALDAEKRQWIVFAFRASLMTSAINTKNKEF